jgi:hypothetical protein
MDFLGINGIRRTAFYRLRFKFGWIAAFELIRLKELEQLLYECKKWW